MLKAIEKAILTSDIGINPTNDGTSIRLVFPELTEDRRKELAKDVKKKREEAKVAVRNIRRDGNVAFKKLKGTEISEKMRSRIWKTSFRRSPISILHRWTRWSRQNPKRS